MRKSRGIPRPLYKNSTLNFTNASEWAWHIIISLYFRVVLFLHPLILILSLNILILSLNIRFDGEHDAMGMGNRLVLRTPPASNGPKCTCTVVTGRGIPRDFRIPCA